MFKLPATEQSANVNIIVDGETVSVPAHLSVAAAVLTHGLGYTRTTPVTGTPRAPFCMMGVCYECLMVIDGRPNRRACQEVVSEGMRIELG